MNKKQIAQAGRILIAYDHTRVVADELDPTREAQDYLTRKLWAASDQLRGAFFDMTGRAPYNVSMTELSTENPAQWAKDYKP